MDKKIAFVTGPPRSGTSWMISMLNEVKETFCLWEGRLFFGDNVVSLFDGLKKGISPWHKWIAHRKRNWLCTDSKIETINKRNWLSWHKFHLERYATHVTGLIVRDLMLNAARNSEAKIVINKDPVSYPGNLRRLMRGLPEAKVIYMDRDIKDTITSSIFTHWKYVKNGGIGIEPFTETDFILTEEFLNKKVSNPVSRDSLEKITRNLMLVRYDDADWYAENEPNRFMIVKYEDLYESESPVPKFKEVLDFLGLEISMDRVTEAVKKSSKFNKEGAIINKEIKMDGTSGKHKLLGSWPNAIMNGVIQKVKDKLNL